MNEDRWERLLAYLHRAWSKPSFDAEERDYRLEMAAELRQVIQLARDGVPWEERLRAATRRLYAGLRRYDLTDRAVHGRWVGLASAEALGAFSDSGVDPMERFRRFVAEVEDRHPRLATPEDLMKASDPERDSLVAFGSILNFALDPEHLPVTGPDVWNLLERTLGYEWTFRLSPVEKYQSHLDFADDVTTRLRDAGIEVRDMLDVQSLIQIAGVQADFWASLPPARSTGHAGRRSDLEGARAKPYLSICAAYRDNAADLPEWIEFHRLVGVERFFLYNNFSEDDHREVLAPYVEEGIVSVQDWPVFSGQKCAYDDCLRWHRHDSRWIAFIDLDEFLFSPTGRPLPEILADYEAWPGVAVAWVTFGTGGHQTRPAGLVIESYLDRIDTSHRNANVKSIVDPPRTIGCHTVHHFDYPYLSAVDENHFPVPSLLAADPSCQLLRLNHYFRKSEEEYIAKTEKFASQGRRAALTEEDLEQLRKREAERGERDETILIYVPQLREALAARGAEPVPPEAAG